MLYSPFVFSYLQFPLLTNTSITLALPSNAPAKKAAMQIPIIVDGDGTEIKEKSGGFLLYYTFHVLLAV